MYSHQVDHQFISIHINSPRFIINHGFPPVIEPPIFTAKAWEGAPLLSLGAMEALEALEALEAQRRSVSVEVSWLIIAEDRHIYTSILYRDK